MKSKLCFSAALLVFFYSFGSFANGSSVRGGGDLCEDRIKMVRDDIKLWIEHKGAEGLIFKKGITVEAYSKSMLEQIEIASIKCVSQGDEGYPVVIDKTPKACRFDKVNELSSITCDTAKFEKMSESQQYVLVHHEYAGLSGLEQPIGPDSSYDLSNQISDYLTQQIVLRLGIKPNTETRVSVTGAIFTRDNSVPALGEAWRDPAGLIWGQQVRENYGTPAYSWKHLNQYDAVDYCKQGGLRLPRKKDFDKLAKFLGKGTAVGYSNRFNEIGWPQILPDLRDYEWTSTTDADGEGYIYYGDSGDYGTRKASDPQNRAVFRCVTEAKLK